MKNSIIIVLILSCLILFSCAKEKKVEVYNSAKSLETELITAIKKGNFKKLQKEEAVYSIIDTLNIYEERCAKADTTYKFNREYMLQTAAINNRDNLLKIFIESGVNPKADYVIKNDFSIDAVKKELAKKENKEFSLEEVAEKIKEDNKGYIEYYTNIGATTSFQIISESATLKDGTVEVKNKLELIITIKNYAWTMANILKKEKTIAVLQQYQIEEPVVENVENQDTDTPTEN